MTPYTFTNFNGDFAMSLTPTPARARIGYRVREIVCHQDGSWSAWHPAELGTYAAWRNAEDLTESQAIEWLLGAL